MLPEAVLEELTNGDFRAARRRAALGRAGAWLRGNPETNRLRSLAAARAALGPVEEVFSGERPVPTRRITGTVGRRDDFDGAFMPLRSGLRERWTRVDRLMHGLVALPPVILYEIEGEYFVLDGHHRVSVARYHGLRYVGAEVTELRRLMGRPLAGDRLEARGLERGG